MNFLCFTAATISMLCILLNHSPGPARISAPEAKLMPIQEATYGQEGQTEPSGQEKSKNEKTDCSDSAKNCREPVCWAGDDGDCSVYICEAGTPKQHIVRVRNKQDKEALYELQSKNRNACPSP